MKTIKQTADFTILQRRDGRYAVRDAKRQFVNGEDKIKVLSAEGLIKLTEPRAESAPPAEQAEAAGGDDAGAAEEASKESGEESGE